MSAPGAALPSRRDAGDLINEIEIGEMVRRFYGDAAQDGLLGPVFNDVAKVNWHEHLPKLTAFWCRALLGQQGYSGNPYRSHAQIHRKQSFTADQFLRWLELFEETIDLGWDGPNAQKAKELARNVARVHSGQLLGQAVEIPTTVE